MEAIEDLIMADDLNAIRETMTDFLLDWVSNADEPDIDERRKKVYHYQVIMDIITQAGAIQDARAAASS